MKIQPIFLRSKSFATAPETKPEKQKTHGKGRGERVRGRGRGRGEDRTIQLQSEFSYGPMGEQSSGKTKYA